MFNVLSLMMCISTAVEDEKTVELQKRCVVVSAFQNTFDQLDTVSGWKVMMNQILEERCCSVLNSNLCDAVSQQLLGLFQKSLDGKELETFSCVACV